MEGLAILRLAQERAMLAGRLRARSVAEGGLRGLERLADRHSAISRAAFSGRAAGGVQLPSAANNNGITSSRANGRW